MALTLGLFFYNCYALNFVRDQYAERAPGAPNVSCKSKFLLSTIFFRKTFIQHQRDSSVRWFFLTISLYLRYRIRILNLFCLHRMKTRTGVTFIRLGSLFRP
jgi:hypothetical protein